MNANSCEELILTSLTQYYNDNPEYKKLLKDVIDGKHKLSLRVIDWLVTHYSKSFNVLYWIHKKSKVIYDTYPVHLDDCKDIKKLNLYLDYRAQLKSYAKINFDSFRRHNRITFFLDLETNEYIQTTIGQLNFFRWAFNNNVLEYANTNYEKIYQHMIENNSYKKQKKTKSSSQSSVQDITNTLCTLRFD
jgi:hypothetical protein